MRRMLSAERERGPGGEGTQHCVTMPFENHAR